MVGKGGFTRTCRFQEFTMAKLAINGFASFLIEIAYLIAIIGSSGNEDRQVQGKTIQKHTDRVRFAFMDC